MKRLEFIEVPPGPDEGDEFREWRIVVDGVELEWTAPDDIELWDCGLAEMWTALGIEFVVTETDSEAA